MIRSKLHTRNMRGTTLLELLIAILVISMIASSIGAAMVAATKDTGFAREQSQATFILQGTTDLLLGYKRSADSDKGYAALTTHSPPSVVLGGKEFARTVEVTTGSAGTPGWCPVTALVGCKLVQVTVTGPSGLKVYSTMVLMNRPTRCSTSACGRAESGVPTSKSSWPL